MSSQGVDIDARIRHRGATPSKVRGSSSLTRSLASILIVVGQLSVLGGSASADEPARHDQSATAEELFQSARRFLTQRDFEAACPLLLESYRLDPAGGTLQNLAICYEEQGKWASAYARFQELRSISMSGDRPRLDRVRLADEHIVRLTPRLTRFVFLLPEDVAATATVSVDGAGYLRAAWSTGIVLDPGNHEVVVTAAGREPYRATIAAKSEGRQDVRVPELKRLPANSEAATAATPRADAPPTRFSTTGIAIGSVGLGILGVGSVFGILTFTTNAAAKDECVRSSTSSNRLGDFDAAGHCYAGSQTQRDANDMKSTARVFANVANVLVPLGALGVGVGVYLLVRKEPRPAVTNIRAFPSLGGAALEGTF